MRGSSVTTRAGTRSTCCPATGISTFSWARTRLTTCSRRCWRSWSDHEDSRADRTCARALRPCRRHPVHAAGRLAAHTGVDGCVPDLSPRGSRAPARHRGASLPARGRCRSAGDHGGRLPRHRHRALHRILDRDRVHAYATPGSGAAARTARGPVRHRPVRHRPAGLERGLGQGRQRHLGDAQAPGEPELRDRRTRGVESVRPRRPTRDAHRGRSAAFRTPAAVDGGCQLLRVPRHALQELHLLPRPCGRKSAALEVRAPAHRRPSSDGSAAPTRRPLTPAVLRLPAGDPRSPGRPLRKLVPVLRPAAARRARGHRERGRSRNEPGMARATAPMTDSPELERRALIVISALTVVSGAGQLLAPGRTLVMLKADDEATTRHLFGTIGMFMVVVGGTLLDGLLRRSDDRRVVWWAASQKGAAATAVAVGVRRGVFSPRALLVAGFDALSGAVALDYWRRMRHAAPR